MNEIIDETIERVAQLYTTLVGVTTQREPNETSTTRPVGSPPSWSPRAAMWNEDGAVVIALDVADVAPEQVAIKVAPFAITVLGERRPPWPTGTRYVAGCELSIGSFSRTFALSTQVTRDYVSARLEAGVLAIRIASGTRAQPSKISIT
ncbi:MAG: Hsp20/alpha crystallin family protein [Kofleriaceae bacterium]